MHWPCSHLPSNSIPCNSSDEPVLTCSPPAALFAVPVVCCWILQQAADAENVSRSKYPQCY